MSAATYTKVQKESPSVENLQYLFNAVRIQFGSVGGYIVINNVVPMMYYLNQAKLAKRKILNILVLESKISKCFK